MLVLFTEQTLSPPGLKPRSFDLATKYANEYTIRVTNFLVVFNKFLHWTDVTTYVINLKSC